MPPERCLDMETVIPTPDGPGEVVPNAEPTRGEPDADPTVTDTGATVSAESGSAGESASVSGESGPPKPDPTGAATGSNATAATTGASSADTAVTSTSDDTPQSHKFRITHETSNEGDDTPHSVIVSAAMDIDAAWKHLEQLGEKLGL